MVGDADVIVMFFLNGEIYGLRQWRHVPRANDEVMLADRDGVKFPAKVLRVVWGVGADTDRRQAVNVEVERIE